MIVVTLNVRGVGGSSKYLALKRLLDLVKPDVLLIQETMVGVAKARDLFVKLLTTLVFLWSGLHRSLCGMLSAWNPRKADFSAYLIPAGILLEGRVKDLDRNLKVINCYGPYSDREVFWEAIKNEGIFKDQNLILGGDLNFTTSFREVWGEHARVDPLQPYFSKLLQEEGMVDVEPLKLQPTWRNGRRGQEFIAKRLDRFLISEDLATTGFRYRSVVCNLNISDHMPVILHLEKDIREVSFPFKFNSIWLDEPEFVNFVRSNWAGLLGSETLNPMESMVKKLKLLKTLMINWEKKKKLKAKEELVKLEEELDISYSNHPGGFENGVEKELIAVKEQRKLVLLRQEEETWRQKSRLNWLASGDRNTKFFHAYANSRKQINTIWELSKEDGTVITSNEDLQKEAVGFFEIFSWPTLTLPLLINLQY
jgi:endonuclease/exonuclease/phosphatase family metal-dependent hydrolase